MATGPVNELVSFMAGVLVASPDIGSRAAVRAAKQYSFTNEVKAIHQAIQQTRDKQTAGRSRKMQPQSSKKQLHRAQKSFIQGG